MSRQQQAHTHALPRGSVAGGWGGDDASQLRQPLLAQTLVGGSNYDTDVSLVEERNRDMKNVEGELLALRDVMRDMQGLVNEGREQLDAAENNVVVSDVRVEKGVEDLTEVCAMCGVGCDRCGGGNGGVLPACVRGHHRFHQCCVDELIMGYIHHHAITGHHWMEQSCIVGAADECLVLKKRL